MHHNKKGILSNSVEDGTFGVPIIQSPAEMLSIRSFHDHVITNEEDDKRIWYYVDTNPQKWQKDCFYIPDEKPGLSH